MLSDLLQSGVEHLLIHRSDNLLQIVGQRTAEAGFAPQTFQYSVGLLGEPVACVTMPILEPPCHSVRAHRQQMAACGRHHASLPTSESAAFVGRSSITRVAAVRPPAHCSWRIRNQRRPEPRRVGALSRHWHGQHLYRQSETNERSPLMSQASPPAWHAWTGAAHRRAHGVRSGRSGRRSNSRINMTRTIRSEQDFTGVVDESTTKLSRI